MNKKLTIIISIILICIIYGKGSTVKYYGDLLLDRSPSVVTQIQTLGGKVIKIDTRVFHHATAVHNPSLLYYQGKKYMTFRVQGHVPNIRKDYAETYLAEVDKNYKIIWAQPLLKRLNYTTYEDARLFVYENELYSSFVIDVSYSEKKKYHYKHRQGITKVNQDLQIPTLITPNIGTNKNKAATEKNWLFFEKDDKKLVINWLDPLTVWEFKGDDYENPIMLKKMPQKIFDWHFGEIRASTNPILINELNQYLVFFHSFEMTFFGVRKYYLGALLFDQNFNITYYTRDPILVSTPHVKPYNGHFTVLPYGCILEDKVLHLSLGINDKEAWIAQIPLTEVLTKMSDVNNPNVSCTPQVKIKN